MSQEKTEIREIELKSQYGKWQVVLDNPNAKRLTIFMLGDRQNGWIPPLKLVHEFKEMLAEAMESDGNRVVVSAHPFISVLQVDLPEGPVAIATPYPKGKESDLTKMSWRFAIQRMGESRQMAVSHPRYPKLAEAYKEMLDMADKLDGLEPIDETPYGVAKKKAG